MTLQLIRRRALPLLVLCSACSGHQLTLLDAQPDHGGATADAGPPSSDGGTDQAPQAPCSDDPAPRPLFAAYDRSVGGMSNMAHLSALTASDQEAAFLWKHEIDPGALGGAPDDLYFARTNQSFALLGAPARISGGYQQPAVAVAAGLFPSGKGYLAVWAEYRAADHEGEKDIALDGTVWVRTVGESGQLEGPRALLWGPSELAGESASRYPSVSVTPDGDELLVLGYVISPDSGLSEWTYLRLSADGSPQGSPHYRFAGDLTRAYGRPHLVPFDKKVFFVAQRSLGAGTTALYVQEARADAQPIDLIQGFGTAARTAEVHDARVWRNQLVVAWSEYVAATQSAQLHFGVFDWKGTLLGRKKLADLSGLKGPGLMVDLRASSGPDDDLLVLWHDPPVSGGSTVNVARVVQGSLDLVQRRPVAIDDSGSWGDEYPIPFVVRGERVLTGWIKYHDGQVYVQQFCVPRPSQQDEPPPAR